jgi:hypothetical protein
MSDTGILRHRRSVSAAEPFQHDSGRIIQDQVPNRSLIHPGDGLDGVHTLYQIVSLGDGAETSAGCRQT